MARHRITFTFNGDPVGGQKIFIDSPSGTTIWKFQFYTHHADLDDVDCFPVRIVAGTPQATNYNFYNAFRNAYNGSGEYTVNTGSNNTAITTNIAFSTPDLGLALPTNVTWLAEELNSPILISSLTVQKHDADTCNYFDVLITASKVFNQILSPVEATFTNTTTYTVEGLSRSGINNIQIKDSDGETASKNIELPTYLNSGVIDISIYNNTLTVHVEQRDLTIEYSLDDLNWQSENIFNDLSGGDYTLYVKDQYDCKVQKTFTIEQGVDGVIRIPDPYFLYPKANCLRMAVREQWDNILINKNSINTLSCETLNGISYTEKQRYRSSDIIQIQIKTNYTDLKVITSDNGTEQTIVQKSANMNVESSMDCKIIDLNNNSLGVYFISGKTYDYSKGTDLGDDYALNGQLPQFAKVGNIITINNFNYTIEAITFNQDLEVDQLIISSSSLSTGDYIIKAVYNVFDYEVYEISINCSGKDTFNIQIWYDEEIKMVSELIFIDDVTTKLALLKWSHKHNTDMFWATGIEPIMRLKYDSIEAIVKNESENYETDSDVVQIKSENYEADNITFLPLTKELARLVVLALSQSNIQVQGIDYIKDGSPEMEALDGSNLYVVTAKMTIKGSGQYREEVDLSNTEIPTLLQTELDGYIKIN